MEVGKSCLYSRRARSGGIHALSSDLLCRIFGSLDHFDLARSSVVCKFWYRTILNSNLWKHLCYKQKQCPVDLSEVHTPNKSWSICLQELAVEQHITYLSAGFAEVSQWRGHSSGVNVCRMKMGLLLTGVGDKVLRLWSSRNHKCLEEYQVPDVLPLIDFDFDENKIVGLVGTHVNIWKRQGKRSILSNKGCVTRTYCMRMHHAPVTCLALTDDQLIVSGSSLGSVSVSDIVSGQDVASLRRSTATGISCLSVNPCSHYVFAGTTSGYAQCWDLRKHQQVWRTRVSPNVLYAMDHLPGDTFCLVVGGIDGVLRVVSANSGITLSAFIPGIDTRRDSDDRLVKKFKAKRATEDDLLTIPRHERPTITCLSVGMHKVATVHNDKHIMMWRFNC
ncbi:F-box/WD-40 repeat-containing protein At3g52030 isoform X3 [Amborella trichopoda]|uniref:F-box/WD-40 repeat-containing protein At3g52030 isoform X3 n=1 Tax=Amborella trichopoda TaxID=13333 RepID=UPI0009C14098|nr:F-box/WD-40 repeat-containing protein At3g52030 isoform X3 [Amborella trichopoda]|eukprot:XP_020528353.1 F-box/WD-40 repeat-containing protein At3g52030 isoform X3 [Amborella trichopoda]